MGYQNQPPQNQRDIYDMFYKIQLVDLFIKLGIYKRETDKNAFEIVVDNAVS